MDAFEMMSGMVETDTYKVTLMNEVGGGQVEVEFKLPDGTTAKKTLPVVHKELRHPDNAKSKGKAVGAEDYKVGGQVRIWSSSRKSWCQGTVVSVRGGEAPAAKKETPKAAGPTDAEDPFSMMAGMGGEELYKVCLMKEVGGPHVTVKFKLPDGKEATKELPSAHQELQAIWAVGDDAEVWSNKHNAWCKGKVLNYRPAMAQPLSGVMEMKVSTKNGPGFYIRSAESFLRGTEAKEAKDGKEAVEAKPPVDVLRISGTGDAINAAITAATRCQLDKLGTITKVETGYPELTSGRGCAQIVITVTRNSLA